MWPQKEKKTKPISRSSGSASSSSLSTVINSGGIYECNAAAAKKKMRLNHAKKEQERTNIL